MPFSPSKASTQRVWCKNAAALAVGLVVFEVGFLAGRVGPEPSYTTAKKILFTPWNATHARPHRRPPTTVSPARPPLPPSLTTVCPLSRGHRDAAFHRAHRFSQPLLMHAYQRFKPGAAAELVLITTGVSMGTFQRNFSAAGCIIGRHVYPVADFAFDRSICTVPRAIRHGSRIGLAVFRDDAVEAALRGPVKIAKEFVAELEHGDLEDLPEGAVLHGELEEYEREELMSVKSKLVWNGQMDPYDVTEYPSLPRYEICIATQIKPSIHLLPDWIDYHRRIGADHIYIFDNDASEDLSVTYAHRHDVEVVYWPWEKSQIQSFTYSLFPLRARCEWLMLMDTDEYIMLGLGEKVSRAPLKDYARKMLAAGFFQVWFHWVIMKNSGFVSPPPEPVPEAYINRQDPQLHAKQKTTLGKTMVQMDKAWVNSNAHSRRARERAPMFDDKAGGMYPSKPGDTAMIVHYRRRSWVEYRDKLKFGRANINNPATVSRLESRDRQAGDQFRDRYMRDSKRNSAVYTHFRDIWRRVTKELAVGPSVTVRYKDGKRCRTFYNFSRVDYATALGEKCFKDDMVS